MKMPAQSISNLHVSSSASLSTALSVNCCCFSKRVVVYVQKMLHNAIQEMEEGEGGEGNTLRVEIPAGWKCFLLRRGTSTGAWVGMHSHQWCPSYAGILPIVLGVQCPYK